MNIVYSAARLTANQDNNIVYVANTTDPDQIFDSFSASTYRSAKYVVQASSGANYQTCEILLMHDGSQVFLTQYASMYTSIVLLTFNADLTSGNLRLKVDPLVPAVIIRAFRILIEV